MKEKVNANVFKIINDKTYLVPKLIDMSKGVSIVDPASIRDSIDIYRKYDRLNVDIDIDLVNISLYPNIDGEYTKVDKMINNILAYGDKSLPIIKQGIVIRLNYEIKTEAYTPTRTRSEDILIEDSDLLLLVNGTDLGNNSIINRYIANFMVRVDTVSHTYEPMILTINSVEILHEQIVYNDTRPKHHRINSASHAVLRPIRNEWYNFGNAYERYYYFFNNGANIGLNISELNDATANINIIPIHKFKIMRSFAVKTGDMVAFRYTVWDNNDSFIDDTTKVAKSLGIVFQKDHHKCDCCKDIDNNNNHQPNNDCCKPPKKHNDLDEVVKTLNKLISLLSPEDESGESQ